MAQLMLATIVLLCAVLFAYGSGSTGLVELLLVCVGYCSWMMFNKYTKQNKQEPEASKKRPANTQQEEKPNTNVQLEQNPENESSMIQRNPASTSPVGASHQGPHYPMLTVANAAGHDAMPRVLIPNAREAVPIKNRNFEGKCLLMLRSRIVPMDPHHAAHFEGKKRMFEFQVQGQFTTPLRGTMYLGGEVPKPMGLSLIARGLAKVLLSAVSALIPGLRSHMGEKDGSVNPYIVFPLWQAVDRMHVTQPGDQPPPLGGEIEETAEQRKVRRASGSNQEFVPFKVGPTYTFNFHTGVVDLLDWKVVNLPAMGDIDLSSFWSNMPLIITMYDIAGDPAVHLNGCKNFLLAWRISHIEDYDPDEVNDGSGACVDTPCERVTCSTLSRASEIEIAGADGEGNRQVRIPFWFEWTDRDSQKRQPLYALCTHALTRGASMKLCVLSDFMPLWCTLFPERPRPSYVEAHRRDARAICEQCIALQLLVSAAATSDNLLVLDALENLISDDSGTVPFLKGITAADLGVKPTSSSMPVHEGAFVRAQWDSHWTQEWGRLYPKRLSIYRTHSRKPSLKIAMSDITDVSAVEASRCPVPGLSVLQIHTAGKVWLLAMSSAAERDLWMEQIQQVRGFRGEGLAGSNGPDLTQLSDVRDSFLSPSYRWWPSECDVLNHRRLLLRPPQGAAARPPVFLAEALLRGCLEWANCILAEQDSRNCSESLLMQEAERSARSFDVSEFLDATVELQGVEGLECLSHLERVSFWTNMYHCLLVHAFITIGPPVSFRKWPAFFNRVCYEVGGCVVSLAEIEHCILRKQSSTARGWLVKTQLPKWAKDDARQLFALKRAEPKVSFLLNCGSVSYPYAIPVFGGEDQVQRQIDAAVTNSLSHLVIVCASKHEIHLPKVCDLYSKDFGNSDIECLQTIQTYMSAPQRESVQRMIESGKAPKLKTSSLSSECRLGFSELNFAGVAPHRKDTIEETALSMLGSSSDDGADGEEVSEMASVQQSAVQSMASLRDGQQRYL